MHASDQIIIIGNQKINVTVCMHVCTLIIYSNNNALNFNII